MSVITPLPSFSSGVPAATPRPASPAPGDAYAPGPTPSDLPNRAALAAAVRGGEPGRAPVLATGAVNGAPMDWALTPGSGEQTRIAGHQNGLPLDILVHRAADGALELEGHQNGRGLYMRLERRADGALKLEGRRTGRGLEYLLTTNRGTLTATGGQDGMVAGFAVASAGPAIALQGGVGGLPAGMRAAATDGRIQAEGGVHGRPFGVTFASSEPLELDRLGDFLPGLSNLERAAVVFVLLSAQPR